jgi:hypothetical protein
MRPVSGIAIVVTRFESKTFYTAQAIYILISSNDEYYSITF